MKKTIHDKNHFFYKDIYTITQSDILCHPAILYLIYKHLLGRRHHEKKANRISSWN